MRSHAEPGAPAAPERASRMPKQTPARLRDPGSSRRGVSAWRRMTAAVLLFPAAFLAAAAWASPATDVDKYLTGLASWSADFQQTIDDGHGHVMRSAAGRLYLQRPGKFRWDYSQPSEQLVLADGKQIWFYDKDLAQANVRDMDASLGSTPASLLSGSGSVGTQFDVTAKPASGGLQWFQLVPKHADTDFQVVRIGFNKNGELASMFLADKLNQITQLTFSNSKRNETFAPDLFSFVPPPGVDVIGRGNGK
jgi:outer membrane lipoprotein carrier protein